MTEPLTLAARQVLRALAEAERDAPGEPLPLRKIATRTLGGDAEAAARVLSELDLAGLLRTTTMGWHFGSLTSRGRDVANAL